jgi:hypothetical protein
MEDTASTAMVLEFQNHLEGLLKKNSGPYHQGFLFSGFGGGVENAHM